MSPKSKVQKVKELQDCLVEGCNAKVASQRKMIAHIREEHDDEVCCPHKDCGKTIKASHIYRHMKEIHGQGLIKKKCIYCGEIKSKNNMATHLKRCAIDSKKDHVCEVENCQASFAVASDLVKHTKNVHTSGKKCPFSNCNAVVKQAHLKQHIKLVHQKVKKTCQICKKQVSYINFDQHLERCNSDGKKMFKCTFKDCMASFTHSRYRTLHMRSVHEKIKKTCQVCNKNIPFTNFSKHARICNSV